MCTDHTVYFQYFPKLVMTKELRERERGREGERERERSINFLCTDSMVFNADNTDMIIQCFLQEFGHFLLPNCLIDNIIDEF